MTKNFRKLEQEKLIKQLNCDHDFDQFKPGGAFYCKKCNLITNNPDIYLSKYKR